MRRYASTYISEVNERDSTTLAVAIVDRDVIETIWLLLYLSPAQQDAYYNNHGANLNWGSSPRREAYPNPGGLPPRRGVLRHGGIDFSHSRLPWPLG